MCLQIRINDIVNEKRSISTNTAIRLSKFFGTTPQFWMNMQLHYDLQKALQEKKDDIENIHIFSKNNPFTLQPENIESVSKI